MKPELTIEQLCQEANKFAKIESSHNEPSLFGITDGKAVGTYLEHKFQNYSEQRYNYVTGSSAKGIDFPALKVDIKVTSNRQPQSSCPFKSARQKVYGLGYSLLIFIYDKTDDPSKRTGQLSIVHTIFVKDERTADFQTTRGIKKILHNDGNIDDLIAFLLERNLPVDDIQAHQLAEEILQNPPIIGYLTISNALQWRLQYRRVINEAGSVSGIVRVL